VWRVIKISLKCPECGSTLKKDNTQSEEELIICQICETQYKITTAQNGKLCLEPFSFDGNDPGEL
jgi:ssDNA-binding Zn-finger/Zn-ribbon topoisomerase 1